MANKQLMDAPWLDILPPPAPVDHSLLFTVLVLGVIGLLLFGLYQLWQRRPRQQALRQLQKLQRQFDQHSLDNKQCLYEINRLLCKGLALNSLARLEDERHFYQRLGQLQYRAEPPAHDDTRQLLAEAYLLLRGSRA